MSNNKSFETDVSSFFVGASFNAIDTAGFPRAFHIEPVNDEAYNILMSRDESFLKEWNTYHGTNYKSAQEAVISPESEESELWLHMYGLFNQYGECEQVGTDIGGNLPQLMPDTRILHVSEEEKEAISSAFVSYIKEQKEKYTEADAIPSWYDDFCLYETVFKSDMFDYSSIELKDVPNHLVYPAQEKKVIGLDENGEYNSVPTQYLESFIGLGNEKIDSLLERQPIRYGNNDGMPVFSTKDLHDGDWINTYVHISAEDETSEVTLVMQIDGTFSTESIEYDIPLLPKEKEALFSLIDKACMIENGLSLADRIEQLANETELVKG